MYRKVSQSKLNSFFIIFLTFLFYFLFNSSFTFPENTITLDCHLDKTTTHLGQELHLTVELVWQGMFSDFQISPLQTPELQNLEIIGSSTANKVENKAEGTYSICTYDFTLKPTQTGSGLVGACSITYKDKEDQEFVLSSQPLPVKIEKRLIPWSEKIEPYKIYFISIIILASVFIFLWRIFIYQKKRKRNLLQVIEPLSIEQKIKIELEEIGNKKDLLEAKDFCAQLAAQLRPYLEKKFNLDLHDVTTPELVQKLVEKGISEVLVQEIEKILSTCDLVKFAWQEINSAQKDKLLDSLKNILSTTDSK